MKQPEALRLADELDDYGGRLTQRTNSTADGLCSASAAELRRLHEVNQGLLEALRKYADGKNWAEDDHGICRVWLEPESDTPTAYYGYELAEKAISKTGGAA